MEKERRRFKRFSVERSGTLHLCRGVQGEKLSRPVTCQIVNLSRHGACLLISRVIMDNYHLFFSPLESEEYILHLDVKLNEESQDESLFLPMKPVCFDRILNEDHKPFKIGVEFIKKLSDEEFHFLKK